MQASATLKQPRPALPSLLAKLALLGLLLICGMPCSFAASLSPDVLAKIKLATFEVVMPKPTDDPLKYEKPLPLDLLPYQYRNDKYISIGTAFALGDHRYITAAHVLDSGIGSLMGAPALRDSDGHVYAIDKILKYSLQQDFVVFSLAATPAQTATLESDTRPALNHTIYAVGNALGTGVVIRDGLYTSDTPEDQNGRWKWMRFSAAASPGNSGGPLLDQDGNVIGIVLMKSPNENLNYALPIGEVLKAPDDLARIDQRLNYQPMFFDTPQSGIFKQEFALPKSFADFSATYLQLGDAFADAQLKALREKNASQLFPQGAGSSRLLHSGADLHMFPSVIRRNSNGIWALSQPRQDREPLPHNGYIASGFSGGLLLLHLHTPDDVPAGKLYADPEQYMDLSLKGWSLTRDVGNAKIRITSLGKPTEDSLFTDGYQRRWQVRVWPLAYVNALVVSFSLPVPDGYVAMMRFVPAGQKHPDMIDMQAMCDFIDASYGGTLAQWKDFLANTALLPAPLSDIRLDLDYGHRFGYHSKRLDFAYPPELLKVAPDSLLMLGFTFGDEHEQPSWNVGDVEARADASHAERINLRRHVAPSADLDSSFHNTWNKFVQRQHPYDSVAYTENDTSRIGTIVGKPDGSPSLLYSATYTVEGTPAQAAMQGKLDLLKDVQVNEH